MSTNISQSCLPQETLQQQQQTTPSYEEQMSWYMRWFALIVLSIGYIASILTGIIGFSITKDAHFLVFVSPTLFTPAIFYLVPMDQKRFELNKLKIQLKLQQEAQKRRNK